MHHLTQRLNDIVQAVNEAGVRCVTDPREANPPCAVIIPSACEVQFGDVNFADYTLSFVAPDIGIPKASEMLYDMIQKASTAITFPNKLNADQVNLGGGTPLPAFTTTLEM